MLEHPTHSHSSAKLATGSSRGLAEQLAILAITHRPHFIEIADRVYELHQGRVDRIDDVKIPATRVT